MRDAIIEESILSLQNEGLRFSVDTLASRLKISKKTVYKYFATKEELAVAVYEKFYKECAERLPVAVSRNDAAAVESLLQTYYKSYLMVREDVFNKYALNDVIKSGALAQHADLWRKISALLRLNDDVVFLTIINGAFCQIKGDEELANKVISKLGVLICL